MTKSPVKSLGGDGQPCAARVDYKGRQGACRRSGTHPDTDGTRWWCGIHNPSRLAKSKPEAEVVRTVASVEVNPKVGKKRPKVTLQPAYEGDGKIVDAEVLVSASRAQVADVRAIEALEEVRITLIELSNTNTVGWDATVPIESYNTIISHMAARAREAQVKLADVLKQLKT